jgi:predicted ester cyclase
MMTTATDTIAANRELGRRFFQEQDRLRGGPAEALCAPEYQATLGGNPPMPREGHEGFAKGFYAAFPDMRHEIADVFATDDSRLRPLRAARHQQRIVFSGCPPLAGASPSAAHVSMHVAAGKVTRLFGIFDEAGLLRQLGVLPDKPTAD